MELRYVITVARSQTARAKAGRPFRRSRQRARCAAKVLLTSGRLREEDGVCVCGEVSLY